MSPDSSGLSQFDASRVGHAGDGDRVVAIPRRDSESGIQTNVTVRAPIGRNLSKSVGSQMGNLNEVFPELGD